MKILQTADFHIGVNIDVKDFGRGESNRLDEIKNVLHEIASYSKNVDILNISGDIFHFSFPSPYLVSIFQDFINEVLANNPKIKIFIIPGNHDFSSISFKHALMSIKESKYERVFVFDKLDNMTVDDCNFVFVPFVGKYFDINNINKELQEKIDKNKKNILVGHFTYLDVTVGSERFMLRDGWAVKEPIQGFDLFLLGHIHGQQSNYPGSPIQTDVGERNDEKGFQIIDTEKIGIKGYKPEFVKLTTYLKYKLIELDHVPTKKELENEYPVTNKNIVVLRLKIKKEDNLNINLIKEYLEQANFYRIEIEYTDSIQTRDETITEKVDPLTALIEYVKKDKECQYPEEIIKEAIQIFAEINKH